MAQDESGNLEAAKDHAERLRREAERAHDQRTQEQVQGFNAVVSFSVNATRAPGVINGAAFAAILAYFVQSRPQDGDIVKVIAEALMLFAAGVLLSGISGGLTYLTQYAYLLSNRASEYRWDYPYVVGHKHNGIWNGVAVILHILTIVVVLLSFALFMLGVYLFIWVLHKQFGFSLLIWS